MQKRANLARSRGIIFCAVYLVATYLAMPNISIGRFDGIHCLERDGVSAYRHIEAGELQFEARVLDTGLVNRVCRQGQLDAKKEKP
jgi:hypothetical protein